MRAVLTSLRRVEVAKLLFFLVITFGCGLVFLFTPSLFPSALLSALLFFVFTPIIDSAERKGISRTVSITGVFLIAAAVVMSAASWITPRITQELDEFQQGSSRYNTSIVERLRHQEQYLFGNIPMVKNAQLADKAVQWLQRSTDKVWAIAPDFASHLMLCLFLVPFLTFILLKDAHEIRRSLLKLVPNRYFETVYSLVSRILDEMGGFVAARIIEAALVTIIVTVSCLALGIPYAILLGVFAGATNAIPYLGPLLGAFPGLLLAIIEPAVPNQLLLVALIYVVANIIDMLLIFPLVVAKIVDLHPVVVVVSVILGSQLFGIVGMIVAVPITSIVKILLQEVYSRVYHETQEVP